MKKRLLTALILLFLLSPAFSQTTKPEKIRVMYATINATVSQLWVAKESGIFGRNGLDVDLLYGAQRTIESLIAGELSFRYIDELEKSGFLRNLYK